MKERFLSLFFAASVVAGVLAVRPSAGAAKDSNAKVTPPAKVAKGKKTTGNQAVPAGVTVNACGCYRNEAGACFCGDKNGACVCPGECEPMSCEQRRAKEMQKEIAAETKKAQDEEKRHQDEAAAAAAAAAASRADAGPAPSSGESVVDDTDDSDGAEKKADDPKPEKRATPTKGRKRASAAKP